MKLNITNRKAVLTAIAALLLVIIAGCAVSAKEGNASKKPDSIAIMTWNVQLLFDGAENGTEYDGFTSASGWNQEKYRGRLNVIAGAIGSMERKPDIVALQEIESAQVMADLAAVLSSQGYRWTHFTVSPGMALGVGLLSRFPLEQERSHSVYVDGDVAPRPMLETRVIIPAAENENGETTTKSLALFVCHWKSKLGGEEETESTRRASARIIVRRLRELAESEPNLPVIVMGDLNENHDEFYRRSGTAVSALLPDDPQAAKRASLHDMDDAPDATITNLQKDFIVISKNKPPEAKHFPAGTTALYSPWDEELKDGSYYYRSNWETIDHFLLSPQLFSGSGWNFKHCEVVNYPPYTNANGLPSAYNPRTGSGLSDHLPLLLFLQMQN